MLIDKAQKRGVRNWANDVRNGEESVPDFNQDLMNVEFSANQYGED